jgi:putative endonuclease
MAWVYILECVDGSFYVGSTTNLGFRVWQHQNGAGAEYTKRRLPVELVFTHETAAIGEAFGLEKQIQGWGRAKREALIRGDFEALPRESSRTRPRSSAGFETRRAKRGAPQPPRQD